MPANESIELYFHDERVTGEATAAITGKRFIVISGNRVSQAKGSTLSYAPATAGVRVHGVAVKDAAVGEKVGAIKQTATIVTCAANLTAMQEVMSDAQGRAIAFDSSVSTNRAAGYAINGAASGADAEIHVY